MKQLELPFSRGPRPAPDPGSAEEIEAHRRRIEGFLTVRMPEPVDLVFTDNRATMISVSSRGGRMRVRLHRLFRHADQDVLEALAGFLSRRGGRPSRALDAFIASHGDEVRRGARARTSAAGRYHDLAAVLERVAAEYFGGRVDVGIGWGRRPRREKGRRAATRALASYCFEERTIRVSPVLDSPIVPAYVVDWIVYHELLHHVAPAVEMDGKRRYHTRRFRALERAFARYEEATAWEKANLDRLLS